jgi:hypothetical protein
MEVDYKKKYHALRLKFTESMDMAFRLGYEQGGKDAQMDQAVQAAADAQAAAAGQQVDENGNPIEGGQPGEEGQEPGQEGQQPPGEGEPQMAGPNQSELDQHIAKLEGIVSQPGSASAPGGEEEIKKSIAGIKEFYLKKSEFERAYNLKKTQYEGLKKSQAAIPAIAKALKGPAKHNFKIGMVASHNLDSNQTKALNMQEKMVDGIMKSWAAEESKVQKSVSNIISVEGLKKD